MTTQWVITLPYPKPPLTLNDPTPWQAKARITRRLRTETAVLARHHKLPTGLTHVTVQLVYTPATNRRRDTDNVAATLKPVCDGLVDYGLVPDDTPDHMTRPEPVITTPDRAKAGVRVIITTEETL